MQKITTHLWFDTQGKEAAAFYTKAFNDTFGDSAETSVIKSTTVLNNTPSGTVDIVTLDLLGQEFTFLSAGPLFRFTPAISFLLACDTKEQVEALWATLSEGGSALMPLQQYPFSEKYGWLQDKYGLSWQIMFMGERPITQRIIPTFMFVGDVCGKAEKAITFYSSLFPDSAIGNIMRYDVGEVPDVAGTIRHAGFTLAGKEFAAMDSAHKHAFTFTEAISFMVHCETQDEIDRYWEKLSAVPAAEQCGWLKDEFGVSWQIVPNVMEKMMKRGSKEQMARVTEAFLKMKKFDIATLQKAYDGN